MHIILLAAVTANGLIAKDSTEPSTAWTSAHDRKFFVEETKKYGVLIMGRNTYKTIGKPLPGRLIIVLTEKPEEINVVPGSVETAQGDLRTIVDDIEKRGYSSLVVAGGAHVYGTFLEAGLVDELALTVEPHLFHSGTNLVSGLTRDLKLNLLDVQRLGEQSILLRYNVQR